jgi:triosephosphate isomerase
MIDSLVVAYEPVWAIGTGRAATPEDAQAMMAHLRRLLAARYGDDAASRVPLLYGGSVTAENVGDFVREKDVDGALVGGASLKPESFVELVANAAEAAAA